MAPGLQQMFGGVIERVVGLMRGGGGDSSPSGDPAARVEHRLMQVGDSCTKAMMLDDVEAAAHFAAMAALGPLTGAMTAARIAFDGSAGALKQSLRHHVAALEAFTRSRIISERDALVTLRADADHWRALSSRVVAVNGQAQQLRTIKGWTGPSADDYGAVVEVQAEALGDLTNFLRQVQESCSRGITLNTHAFMQVERTLAHVGQSIPGAGGGGSTFYRRTADAVSRLRPLIQQIDPKALAAWSAGNRVAGASGEAMTSMETLSPHYWPTGSSGAGIPVPNTP